MSMLLPNLKLKTIHFNYIYKTYMLRRIKTVDILNLHKRSKK